MRLAVCCPGPTLMSTWNPEEYDRVWAINRALLVVNADWLSAGDIVLFQGLLGQARPRIGVLTSRDTAAHIWDDRSWGLKASWEDRPLIARHPRPIQWSVQAALLHAAEYGFEIDLHGTIRNGNPEDCTGYVGENRSAERWAREDADILTTIEFMRDFGVTVRRMIPRPQINKGDA